MKLEGFDAAEALPAAAAATAAKYSIKSYKLIEQLGHGHWHDQAMALWGVGCKGGRRTRRWGGGRCCQGRVKGLAILQSGA